MMARDLKPLRQENSLILAPARSLVRLSRGPEGRRVLGWRFRRLTSVDALQEQLGHPGTILCLGNGPSSESEALKQYPHDALFRVNHSWLKRPAFNRPDVVFTGGGPTMRAVSGAIFGLQALGAEVRLASTRGLNPLSRGCTFFNVHDLTGSLEAFDWGHLRPTNGASMLAAAVALAPARLIIARSTCSSIRRAAIPATAPAPMPMRQVTAGRPNWSSFSGCWPPIAASLSSSATSWRRPGRPTGRLCPGAEPARCRPTRQGCG